MEAKPARKPRLAAAVLMRRRGVPRSTYLVARRPELAFFGGYWAFPGGTLDAADLTTPIAGRALRDEAEHAMVVAAARELFEETGVLCVLPAILEAADRDALRQELLAGRIAFAAELVARRLAVDADRFQPICRMTTPIFAPVRYETEFFIVDLEPGEVPSIIPGELTEGAFVDAGEILQRWRTGDISIVPPALILLEHLARAPGEDPTTAFCAAARDLTASYARGKIHHVFFSPGIRKLTLRTETLPPADHTNAYLIGHDPAYLVDPGATRAEEHAKLFETIDEARAAGVRLVAILLTHAHPDHIGAVPAAAERYGLPVWAHADAARVLGDRIPIARMLQDGERLPLGTAPDGTPDWTLEVVYTPGHAPGHLAFRESRYGALVVGDMISTVSTILVAPPDGHLATYLHSLHRLRALPSATLYPAHGPAKRESHAVLDQYVQHRAMRERKIAAALTAEPRPLDVILVQAYDDVTPEAMPLARRALEAGLVKLCEDGVAIAANGGYRSA